jgi:hypothetical protein
MKYWFFMLLRPMIFIDTIVICSWDTCTINMLANNKDKQLERMKSNATNAKGKI